MRDPFHPIPLVVDSDPFALEYFVSLARGFSPRELAWRIQMPLAAWARDTHHERKKVAAIIEILNQSNEVLGDFLWGGTTSHNNRMAELRRLFRPWPRKRRSRAKPFGNPWTTLTEGKP